jgi:hypothetical protein
MRTSEKPVQALETATAPKLPTSKRERATAVEAVLKAPASWPVHGLLRTLFNPDAKVHSEPEQHASKDLLP